MPDPNIQDPPVKNKFVLSADELRSAAHKPAPDQQPKANPFVLDQETLNSVKKKVTSTASGTPSAPTSSANQGASIADIGKAQANFNNNQLTDQDAAVIAANDHTNSSGLVGLSPEETKAYVQAHNGPKMSSLYEQTFNIVTTGIPDSPDPKINTQRQKLLSGVRSGDQEAITTAKNYINTGLQKQIDAIRSQATKPLPGGGFAGPAQEFYNPSPDQKAQIETLTKKQEEVTQTLNDYAVNTAANTKETQAQVRAEVSGAQRGNTPNIAAEDLGKQVEKINGGLPNPNGNIQYARQQAGFNTLIQNKQLKINDLTTQGLKSKNQTLLQQAENEKVELAVLQNKSDNLINQFPDVATTQVSRIIGDELTESKPRLAVISKQDVLESAARIEEKYPGFMSRYGKYVNVVAESEGEGFSVLPGIGAGKSGMVPTAGFWGGLAAGTRETLFGASEFVANRLGDEKTAKYIEENKETPVTRGAKQAGVTPTKVIYDVNGKSLVERQNEHYGEINWNSSTRFIGQSLPGLAAWMIPEMAGEALIAKGIGLGAKAVNAVGKTVNATTNIITGASDVAAGYSAVKPGVKAVEFAKSFGGKIAAATATGYDNNYKLADKLILDNSSDGEAKKALFATAATVMTAGAFQLLHVSPSDYINNAVTKAVAPDIMKVFEENGYKQLTKTQAQDLMINTILPKVKTFGVELGKSIGQGGKIASAQLADTKVKEFVSTVINPEVGRQNATTIDDNVKEFAKQTFLMGLLGLPKMVVAGINSPSFKDVAYEIGSRAPQYIDQINQDVAAGSISRAEGDKFVSAAKTLGEEFALSQYERTDEGQPLTIKQKRDLMVQNFRKRAAEGLKEAGAPVSPEKVKSEADDEIKIIKSQNTMLPLEETEAFKTAIEVDKEGKEIGKPETIEQIDDSKKYRYSKNGKETTSSGLQLQAHLPDSPEYVEPKFKLKLSGSFTNNSEALKNSESTHNEIRKLGSENPLNNREVVIDNVKIETEPTGDGLRIKSIQAIEKGKGTGTAVLNKIKKIADENNTPIILYPEKIESTSKEKLVEWYSKNGFVEYKNDQMIYTPKAEEKIEKPDIAGATTLIQEAAEEGTFTGTYADMIKADPKNTEMVLQDIAQQAHGVDKDGKPVEGGPREADMKKSNSGIPVEVVDAAMQAFPVESISSPKIKSNENQTENSKSVKAEGENVSKTSSGEGPEKQKGNVENKPGSKETAPAISKEERLKTAQSEFDKATKELKKAEDKLSNTQGTQLKIGEAAQPDLFAVERPEAKAILDPLRKNVKETKAELDKINAEQVKNEKQAGLFKEPEKKPDETKKESQPRVKPYQSPLDIKGYRPDEIMHFNQGMDNNRVTLIVEPHVKEDYSFESRKRKNMNGGLGIPFKHILKDVAKSFRAMEGKDVILDLRGVDLKQPLADIVAELNKKPEVKKAEEKPAETQKPSEKLKGTTIEKAQQIEDLMTPHDIVLQHFTGSGRVHPSAIEDLFGAEHKSEVKMRSGLVDEKGQTIDQLAHELMERDPSGKYNERDYKDAIEEVLSTHTTRTSMAADLVDRYIDNLEQGMDMKIADGVDFDPSEIEKWKSLSDIEKEAAMNMSDDAADQILRAEITDENINQLNDLLHGESIRNELASKESESIPEVKGGQPVQEQNVSREVSNQSEPEQAATALRESAQRLADDGDRDGALKLYREADRVESGKPPPPEEGATETGAEPSGATGVKKAVIKEEREAAGKSPIENQLRRDFPEVIDNAKELLANNPTTFVTALKNSIDKFLRPLTAEETVALSIRKAELSNETRRVSQSVLDSIASGNKTAETLGRERLMQLEIERDNIDRIATRTNYEKGLSLAVNKLLIQEDYSAEKLVQRAKALTADGEISEAQQKKFEDLSAKLDEANKKLEEHEQKIAKLEAERKVKDMAKEAGESKFKVKKEKLAAERKDLINQFKNELKNPEGPARQGLPLTDKMVGIVAKLARNYVEDGVVRLQEVVTNIINDLKEHAPDLSEEDVRNAISGYGQPKKSTYGELAKQMQELRKQAELISKIEDINAGRGIKNKERAERRKQSPEVQKLNEELMDAMKAAGIDPYKERALKAYKTRLENQRDKLKEKLQNRDFAKEAKKEFFSDPEGQKLQAEVNNVKKDIRKELKKIELDERPKWLKTADFLAAWRRAVLLSSITTLGKLTSAAAERSIISPIEELAGAAIHFIPGLSQIAKMAPREGGGSRTMSWGVNLAAEGSAAKVWGQKNTLLEMRKELHGKSSLKLLYGKEPDLPQTALDWFGRVHAALKTPAKINEFRRAVRIRTDYAYRNGEDLSDPMVNLAIETKAFADAERAIFQQDNIFTSKYQSIVEALGRGSKAEKVSGDVLKMLLPIVKVPTNFVWETSSYAAGALKALPGVYKAISKGVESLKPEEADFVIRALKKQGLGLGMLALGYFGAGSVGGYYTGKRKEGDLKAGDVNAFGVHLPHWMLHAPLIEILQIGATLRRVHDEYEEKGEDGAAPATLTAVKGLFGQVPFFAEAGTLGRMVENTKSFGGGAGEFVKSFVVPPSIQNIAKEGIPFTGGVGGDLDANGEPNIRKPQTFLEHIETGIPGLRGDVTSEAEAKQISKDKAHATRERNKAKKEAAEVEP